MTSQAAKAHPMKWTTPVAISPCQQQRLYREPFLLLGSCFSEHIVRELCRSGVAAYGDVGGVTYNPLSMAEHLGRILDGTLYTEADLVARGDYYHSWLHSTLYGSDSPLQALDRMNQSLLDAMYVSSSRGQLCVTWGTAWVYRYGAEGRIVNNCHKYPDASFSRHLLRPDEIVEVWAPLLERMAAVGWCPIVFTVSPVRHTRDGLHANQLSKSVLLLAIEELARRYPRQVYYFPAYEIVLDELRDYRFYADDLTHPSASAVQYVWQRFSETLFTPEALVAMQEYRRIRKGYDHRPSDPSSRAYRDHVEQLCRQEELFLVKYPKPIRSL